MAVQVQSGLGLCHARLSLVDTSDRSNQPMWDESGRYGLIYNGEIYNFRELRQVLEARGVTFKTTSDTETVLQYLIAYGSKALEKFNGMFGLAFVDQQEGSVLLARDRFGMKPLYWSTQTIEGEQALLFGSEVKSFEPWMDLEPDMNSLSAYLMKFGGPTSGRTFYKGITALKPGTCLQFNPGKPDGIVIEPFFRLVDFVDEDEIARLKSLSAVAVADEFDELMQNSVRSQLFADAKVGAFCSGGVDSSLITSIAARQTNDVALFHANVKGGWSEFEPASALAKHLGLDLHHIEVEEQDFVDLIPRVTRHYEYPFSYHRNSAPLMLIAEKARDQGVKGLLSGEGADELFLGYPWLGRKGITDFYDRMTGRVGSMVRSVPGVGPILAPDRRGNTDMVRNILNNREMADDLELVSETLSRMKAASKDKTIGWSLDYLHYHLRTLLHRNDTMGMAASIEARFPFLDTHLAKFGVNLPGRHKLRASPFVFEKAHPFVRDKWVVREVADRYVPKHLSRRIKVGFWTTVFDRLQISPSFFTGSRIAEVMELSGSQMRQTVALATPDLQLRLMLADVWVSSVLEKEDMNVTTARLRDHVKILPEGRRVKRPKPAVAPQRTPVAPI